MGAVDAYSNYSINSILFLIASKSTIRRFPKLKEKCKLILIPKAIDNVFIRDIIRGRFFSLLCTFFLPVYVSYKLRSSNTICSQYSLIVYLNSNGGAFLKFLMPFFKLNLTKSILSLTGMPSFLLNLNSQWRVIESKIILFLWKKITLKKYNYIYCLSKKTREACLEKFSLSQDIKSKLLYVPNPCFSNDRFQKLNQIKYLVKDKYKKKESSNNVIKLVLVGRFTHQKNQSLAIKVIKNCFTNNLGFKLQLDLIGDGEDKSSLSNLIKKEKLSNSVILKPFNNNILDDLLKYDLVLCTSLWEDSSVFLNEVLSIGIPMVAPKGLHGLEDHSNNSLISDLFFSSYSTKDILDRIILFFDRRDFYRDAFISLSDKTLSLHTSLYYYKVTSRYLSLES